LPKGFFLLAFLPDLGQDQDMAQPSFPSPNRCKGCGEESQAAFCADCLTTPIFQDFTRAELRNGFDLIAPKDNWKMPINAALPEGLSGRELMAIQAGIEFYTASQPSFEMVGGRVTRVRAAGYYAAVGA
jgi:hypothetical protein